jgi:sugar/nucleoside kinase (ribokinase family)
MSDHVNPIDVVGIGNALVDVLTHASDDFVAEQGLVKGSMTLIDAERAVELYGAMGTTSEVSGGSAANTIVGAASLGATSAYIGKVRNDSLGDVFAGDMTAQGITFDVPRAETGDPTGRCLILVSDDGERTMSTYLGASVGLSPSDIDADLVRSGKLLYLEGYLWDPPLAKAAMREACSIARAAGNMVTLTLSDSFCVERHRESFIELIDQHVDVLFANEDEIMSLYEVDNLDAVIERIRGHVGIGAITRSSKGSSIITDNERIDIPAEPVAHVIDTTGAGDLYAAGFLTGMAKGLDLEICGRLGSIAAAEVISHMGPRPEKSLLELAGHML